MAVDTDSTKPSKVVKVMTKSMLLLNSTSRTTVKVTCWKQETLFMAVR